MNPLSQSKDNSDNNLAAITFKCAKCGAENHLKTDQKELLFGGADPVSGGNRPIQDLPTARTFIVRCNACQHLNRIRIEGGAP